MGGRHRPARRRRSRAIPAASGLSAIAAGLAVLAVLAGSWGAYRLLAKPLCGQQVRLAVAAAAEIAPVVEQTAGDAANTDLRAQGVWVSVDVTPADPADVAAHLPRLHQAAL